MDLNMGSQNIMGSDYGSNITECTSQPWFQLFIVFVLFTIKITSNRLNRLWVFVPVTGTFNKTGIFTNFGILVVTVPNSQNLPFFRYLVPVLPMADYWHQYWHRRYQLFSVLDTGF